MGTDYLRDVVKPSQLLDADLISQAYVIMAEKAQSLGIDFTAQTNCFMTREFLRQTYVTVGCTCITQNPLVQKTGSQHLQEIIIVSGLAIVQSEWYEQSYCNTSQARSTQSWKSEDLSWLCLRG
eukprot:scaffold307547_cov19-Prasinocladus_malaysianus.AAC.2